MEPNAPKEISNEKLSEVQADLNALMEKHGVDLKVQIKQEIVVTPREPK